LLFTVACAGIGITTYVIVQRSVMSYIDTQLGAAAGRWPACLEHSSKGTINLRDPECMGQQEGTFGARVKNGVVTNSGCVAKSQANCQLSAADKATLLALAQAVPPAKPSSQHASVLRACTRDFSSIGGDYRVTAQTGGDGDILITAYPLADVQHTLFTVAAAEVVIFAVVLLLALGLSTGLVRLSLRPLRRVAATATRVTELSLDSGEVVMPAPVPDADPGTEVGQVGAAFNRMLGHVEAALARRAASESRLRRFAADASHELRTPLSAIRGYAELALRHHGPVPEEVTHALKRVESESARMSVLVDDLLLLARLDAGRPLARDPVDLTRLAIDTTSDAQVARNDHRWLLELPDEPVMVRGDESRLHQVLANLLSNAGKHTPAGSTVTVSLTASSQPWVELSVTDDGPGISADLLPDLFERFVRADTSRAHEGASPSGSTGLGLAIVDAVVTAHRGSVSVTSRPGRTNFTIRLPRLEAEPKPAGGTQPLSRSHSHRHR
jgi:two-component system OmpR family sensor kinase